jgi:hypothetical protein
VLGTEEGLAAVLDFALSAGRPVRRVGEAASALRGLLRAAGVEFRFVGGLAVFHHGYGRTTLDLDVLLERAGGERLDGLLAEHGFERLSPGRLSHLATGVPVDLLLAGEPMPRPGSPPYPAPETLGTSPSDPAFVDLAGLLLLKLLAGRQQDSADVVALLKPLGEGEYLGVEAALPTELRSKLWQARQAALEEAAWEGRRDVPEA